MQNKYKIVARYLNGTEVAGYHLECNNDRSGFYSREQVILLVSKGQIINCKGQLVKDGVALIGNGINLKDLPNMQYTTELENIDEKQYKSRTNRITDTTNERQYKSNTKNTITNRLSENYEEVVQEYKVINIILDGNSIDGFLIVDKNNNKLSISKSKAINMAESGRFINAGCEIVNGRKILRGIGIDLRRLPAIQKNR